MMEHSPSAPGAFRTTRIASLIALALLSALVAGCSLGYRNLHPGEDSAIYAPLFDDIITRHDSPEWLWTRGTIAGDFDADSKVDEEAVIATIQAGDRDKPGRILEAFLVVCKINADGSRTAIARTKLFDQNPIATAVKVENGVFVPSPQPLTNARAQIVTSRTQFGDTIIVFFWGDDYPANTWYAAYIIQDGMLVKTLDIALAQFNHGVIQTNFERSVLSDVNDYQLAVSEAALPESITRKLGESFTPPLWGHIFAKDVNGFYRQCDAVYGDQYSRTQDSWSQAYLQAMMIGELNSSELAWFEYYLGMIHHFMGKNDMSGKYLDKAAKGATDPRLVAAVEKARRLPAIAKP